MNYDAICPFPDELRVFVMEERAYAIPFFAIKAESAGTVAPAYNVHRWMQAFRKLFTNSRLDAHAKSYMVSKT